MDEELNAYLDAMRREIDDGQERLLNRLGTLEQALSTPEAFWFKAPSCRAGADGP